MLPALERRSSEGMLDTRDAIIGLTGAVESRGLSKDGLLQTFFKTVMSCREASGFPKAA